MLAYMPIRTCSKRIVCFTGNTRTQTMIRAYSDTSHQSSCYNHTVSKNPRLHFSPINGPNWNDLMFTKLIRPRLHRNTRVDISTGNGDVDFSFFVLKKSSSAKAKCHVGPFYSNPQNLYSGVFIGLLLCFCASQPSHAEAHEGNQEKGGYCDSYSDDHSHDKEVLTDYSVIGIPGDGRCLFRSVVHGACIRSGKPAPNENLQRELADELRARVADEFIKRREETEWFIEGDFGTYVSQIRKPHVWGGEPELLMASHFLRMPITVYMKDEESGRLRCIAEYGQQEYGKENPINVLYHGYGHYDALHLPGQGGVPWPRL